MVAGRLTRALGGSTVAIRMRRGAIVAVFLAIVLAIIAAYLLLWTISSSSLAFAECVSYRFFAANPRCRIAAWTSIAFVIAAILCLTAVTTSVVLFIRSRQRNALSDESAA